MKKLVILTGTLLIAAFSYANRNENVNNIVSNYYQNDGMTLNVKNKSVSTSVSENNNVNLTQMSTASSVRDQIISFAQRKLGSPYVWGATGPNSFDCSGFVGYVFKNSANVNLPRVSSSQATFKPRISSMNMKKGDLVFFETTGRGRISHVGIYMGNRQFIHASSGSKRVTVSSLDSKYYSKAFRWAIDPLQ